MIRWILGRLILIAALVLWMPSPAAAADFNEAPHDFPPPSETRHVKFRGHFRTVLPAWPWSFLVNMRKNASWQHPHQMIPHMKKGNLKGLTFTHVLAPGAAKNDLKGTYRYSVGKRTGSAAEDNGEEVRLFQINPETGFVAQGIQVSNFSANPKHDPKREWRALLNAFHWPAWEKCEAWLATWKPPAVADPNDPMAAFRKGPVVQVKMGGIPAWAVRMSHRSLSQHFSNLAVHVTTVHYAACVDSTRGRYTLTMDASENVFDELFPIMERAMDEFRLEPDDVKSEWGCPNDLFIRNGGNAIKPYLCASACPSGSMPSPPGDFPYKGARFCVSANSR